jgi:cellulose synthase (UDP-forming)
VPQSRWGRWWEEHPALLRTVAVLALGWGTVYLVWRLLETGRAVSPEAFYVLWLVELYNFISLALLAFFGWRWSEAQRRPATPGYSVDVFVATYNEPREVVEATLAGCAALRYPHETYLLDDGRRLEMAALAGEWGAHWVTRPDNSHAKAGNINHALGCTSGELIFCLDADHVPLPDALDAIVGYFDDDKVALVQTPHDFYNHDSVQHYEVGRHEQSLFFEVVCPGKDRHNRVFWCGSASLLRREALVGVGGVSTETIAEDFHTTIKMHRAGWKTCYHDEVLVQGLAPMDLDGYLLQRDRWARGNLAVFSLPESPLRPASGLSLRQRVSYFGSLFAYGAGAARLAMIGLLVAVLAAGVLPARMSVLSLAIFWAPWTVLALISASALCRGHLRMGESSHYTLVTAAVFTRALRCAVVPSRTKFKVTPKEGVDTGGLRSLRQVRLVALLGVALAGGLVWRGLGLLGYVHVRPLPAWAATFAMILGTWELYRVARSLQIVVRRRQRRERFRFACLAPATIADEADEAHEHSYGRVVDVSLSGIGLLVGRQIERGMRLHVVFVLSGLEGKTLPVTLTAVVQSARPAWWMGADQPGGWRIGLSIVEIDDGSRDNLVRYCYVVHPWQRLRESRLEVQVPTESSPILAGSGILTGANGANGEIGVPVRERSAVG